MNFGDAKNMPNVFVLNFPGISNTPCEVLENPKWHSLVCQLRQHTDESHFLALILARKESLCQSKVCSHQGVILIM